MCSFKVDTPICPVRPPVWDLEWVLHFLIFSSFKPLSSTPFPILTKMVLFSVYLGYGQEGRELQAVSRYVSFVSPVVCVASVPDFLTKTEYSSHPLSHSFLVKPLLDFAVCLDQDCCCALSVPCLCIS